MRRLLLSALAAVALLASAAPASADTLTGRLLVTLEPQATPRAQASALDLAGARRTGPRVPEIDLVTVRPGAGESLAATLRALRGHPAVAHVQTERRHELRAETNDPALTGQEGASGTPAGTPLQWWAERQNLFAAWDVTRGARATVAVIDTGIDANHPDLAGKIAATADQDGSDAGPPTVDENGHGTHVSSMACAAGDNGVGLVGAGLDCRLIVVKSDLTDASVAASIVEATNLGAHAINMSFGTDGSRPAARAIVEAIDFALSEDVVLVAAAADEPTEEQGDPANVLQPTGTGGDLTAGKGLSVTSASFYDRRSSFAGRGSQISLSAYGSFDDNSGPPGILGAFPGNPTDLEQGSFIPAQPACGCRTAVDGDGRFAYLQGTSMAAPMVAAVAALTRELNPDLRATEVIRLIKEEARRPPGSGWEPELGWGILDAGAVLQAARLVDRRAPASKARAVRRVRDARSFTLEWNGSDRAPRGVKRSGIRVYEVFRSANGGPYRRIARTRRNRMTIRARPGSYYRFYTRAADRSGNREPVPSRNDVTVRVDDR